MKSDFSKLKRKILFQAILITLIGVGIGLLIQYVFIDGIFQAPFADAFIAICERLGMDYYSAAELYRRLFMSQKPLLLLIGLIVLMMFVFYYSLSRMIKYFNEIGGGINKLVDESSGAIYLSPEIQAVEDKLNSVRTTLDRRREAVREAEQKKNDLVMYLAHDIRTPLTSIIGYLNLLKESPDMPVETRANYMGITLENAIKLEKLINEFFDITRFSLQTIQLNKEEINLTYMLLQMAEEFYPILDPQNKSIVVKAEEELTVYGDGDKLARVFYNILKNAVAFSNPGTEIIIEAKEENDEIWVTFTDQGKIVPEEELESIFEKFYRLDASRSRETGGTGLGLAIAKEIVTAHEGDIFANSLEGKTIFTVVLPKMLRES